MQVTPASRTIVVPLVVAGDRVLLCRMASDRGVFPGQWALPGGGVEPGERLEQALRRETRFCSSGVVRSGAGSNRARLRRAGVTNLLPDFNDAAGAEAALKAAICPVGAECG